MKDKNSNSIKEEKLKPLAPTLRTKKRFVKIKVSSKVKFNFNELSESLTKDILFYMGSIDFGKGGVWFVKDKFNEESQDLVIKVGTKFKDKLLASLALIEKISNKEANLEIIKVSGTLKGLEKK